MRKESVRSPNGWDAVCGRRMGSGAGLAGCLGAAFLLVVKGGEPSQKGLIGSVQRAGLKDLGGAIAERNDNEAAPDGDSIPGRNGSAIRRDL